MIPFVYVCCFVSSLIRIHTPLLNEPLVYEDCYEIFAVKERPESFMKFSWDIQYKDGTQFIKIVEVKF